MVMASCIQQQASTRQHVTKCAHQPTVQIEAIRSEMDIEVNRLIAIIHKKNVDLTDLETKLVNRLRWGIVVLQSKNENLIRRQVLQWWRYQTCTHSRYT